MSTISNEELVSLYQLSNTKLKTNGWRVDWFGDIVESYKGKDLFSTSISPQDFYEKTFQINDLGILYVSNFYGKTLINKCSTHIRESVCLSYRMHADFSKEYVFSPDLITNLFIDINNTYLIMKNLLEEAELDTTVVTFSLCFSLKPNQLKMRDNITNLLSEYQFHLSNKDNANLILCSSVVENSFIFKLFNDQFEHYLIFSFDDISKIALDKIYYLMIAKKSIKRLSGQIENRILNNLINIQKSVKGIKFKNKVTHKDIEELLELKKKIIEESNHYDILNSYGELIQNFLNYHLLPFLKQEDNSFLEKTPGLLSYERENFEIFYLNELNNFMSRTEKMITEVNSFLSTVIDILLMKINLRSQLLIERLEIVGLFIAIAALGVAIITIIN